MRRIILPLPIHRLAVSLLPLNQCHYHLLSLQLSTSTGLWAVRHHQPPFKNPHHGHYRWRFHLFKTERSLIAYHQPPDANESKREVAVPSWGCGIVRGRGREKAASLAVLLGTNMEIPFLYKKETTILITTYSSYIAFHVWNAECSIECNWIKQLFVFVSLGVSH